MSYALLIVAATNGLFAQINWQPLFDDHGIPLAIMGLVVVFGALTLLRIFIGLLPRVMAVLDRLLPEEKEVPHGAASQPVVTDGLPDEIVAVIAAAVAATVCEPHRIVRTRDLSSEDMNWSLEGRRQHHASHRIQPRDRPNP